MRTRLLLPALVCLLAFTACQKDNLSETLLPDGVTTARARPPFNLKATEIRGASAELNWEYTGNASTFQVQVYVGSGHQPEVLLTEYFPVNRSVTVTGLSPMQDYTFQVRALGGTDGDSDWSKYAVFNSRELLYAPPANLNIRSLAGNEVYISWDRVPGAEGYVVEIERVSLLPEPVMQIAVQKTHTVLYHADPNTPYRVRVAASGSRGQGAWPKWQTFTYEPVPPYTLDDK